MDENERRQAIEDFADMVRDCESAVVFTGAGISTESGIPDFRSPGGIWTKMAPISYQEFVRSEDMRREAWRRKFAMDESFAAAVPNVGHAAISAMVRRGIASTVITQNIDGLHQASGIPDDKVIELHGNTTYAKCLNCDHRYELDAIRGPFLDEGRLPKCGHCGGMIKTATISFGQAMPEEPMRRAHEAALSCDLLIAIGSSLVVYPAAGFPLLAKEAGATLVILNREPTPLDDDADLVIRAEIGPTLKCVVPMN